MHAAVIYNNISDWLFALRSGSSSFVLDPHVFFEFSKSIQDQYQQKGLENRHAGTVNNRRMVPRPAFQRDVAHGVASYAHGEKLGDRLQPPGLSFDGPHETLKQSVYSIIPDGQK